MTHPLISLDAVHAQIQKLRAGNQNAPEEHGEGGQGAAEHTDLPARVTETQERHEPPRAEGCPQLTGTSKASWVSSSIWILTDMSFPEGVGGGFCPCSKVLIPEFSGAPSLDPGVGLCSISPMMRADYMIPAGSREKENTSGDSSPKPPQ